MALGDSNSVYIEVRGTNYKDSPDKGKDCIIVDSANEHVTKIVITRKDQIEDMFNQLLDAHNNLNKILKHG